MRPPLYASKTHVPDYRALFPAIILARTLSAGGVWRHAWIELTPGGTNAYSVNPGARSGTVDVNYALEENNRATEPGTVVWLRHRDEDGGVIHLSFHAPLGSTLPLGPPPSQSGSPPAQLCLTITDWAGCGCLAGAYTLEYAAPIEAWIASGAVCGLGYEFIYRQQSGGSGYELGVLVSGTAVGSSWFPVSSLPFEAEEVPVSGSACDGEVSLTLSSGPCGDCAFSVTGSGKVCLGPNVTVSLGNTFPQDVVSQVCAEFGYIEPGDGIHIERLSTNRYRIGLASGGEGAGETIRYVAGIRVQKQTAQLPVGLAVGAAECRENPSDCCASGGSLGCCFPRPPDVIYGWRLAATDGCGCVERCVRLEYSAERDAWYSGPVAADCGVSAEAVLRLLCEEGAYRLDVVEAGSSVAADFILLRGAPRGGVSPSCDPFLAAWDFDDPEPEACSAEGQFAYLLTEVPCDEGSGGGGAGGTVESACCPGEQIPTTLACAFGGALAALGTVTLEFIGSQTWFAQLNDSPCGDVAVTFFCQGVAGAPGTGFQMSLLGDTAGSSETAGADECDPLRVRLVGDAFGNCHGDFTAEITPG